MTAENMQSKNQAGALDDAELGEVAGGGVDTYCTTNGKYYHYTGTQSGEYGFTAYGTYRCPNCNRPLHYGSWLRWYCDPCNASWFSTDRLIPNEEDGLWKEISKKEYYST